MGNGKYGCVKRNKKKSKKTVKGEIRPTSTKKTKKGRKQGQLKQKKTPKRKKNPSESR